LFCETSVWWFPRANHEPNQTGPESQKKPE
jgi:hypothetical protein